MLPKMDLGHCISNEDLLRAVVLKHFHNKGPKIDTYLAKDPHFKGFCARDPHKSVVLKNVNVNNSSFKNRLSTSSKRVPMLHV